MSDSIELLKSINNINMLAIDTMLASFKITQQQVSDLVIRNIELEKKNSELEARFNKLYDNYLVLNNISIGYYNTINLINNSLVNQQHQINNLLSKIEK